MQTSWVDLIEWDPLTRSGFVVVRAYIEDGKVKFDGDAVVLKKLLESQPSDPFAFLTSLSKTFRNPYLLATEVHTGKLPKDFGPVEMIVTPT